MAQELKDNGIDEKYAQSDSEDCVNQEVIVNDKDLRIKVLKSNDKGESVMECIGNLISKYIYDTNGYRQTTAGTATVFHVGSKGETYAVTCAHNVRRLIYKCFDCGKYMEEKKQHGKCNINHLKTQIIKANNITFEKRCIVRKKLQPLNNGATEVIEYGDIENVYEIDIENIFINEKMYSLYPSGSSGYDLCIVKFINNTNDYKNLVKNIRIANGKKTILEMGYFEIWGFPGDKLKKVNGQNEQDGLYGMKSHKNGNYSFPIHKKTLKIYFRQNIIDAYSGQSGSSIWVKKKEKYLMGWAEKDIIVLCGVHTGGNVKYKHNVGVLFDDFILKQINNFINNKSNPFECDKFDIKNIGKYHTLNGNVITQNTQGWSSSFLSNILSDGKHIWTFKIKSEDCGAIILGI
eukprot:494631_1